MTNATTTTRSWDRDPALEARILAAIAAAPDGLDVTELAEKVVDYAATAITRQMRSRVQLSCWDLANEGTIRHAAPSQRYILVSPRPAA